MDALISELTLMQTLLIVYYVVYTLIRAIWILCFGLKVVAFRNGATSIKLYQIIWVIIDIPAIILSMIFKAFKFLLLIPVIPLRQDKK